MSIFLNTLKVLSKAIATLAFMTIATSAAKADAIEGAWATSKGGEIQITACGSSFCGVSKSGEFTGTQIAKLKKKGKLYVGSLIDPKDNKKYTGSAKLIEERLSITACAYKIYCTNKTWTRITAK